jgi:energy-coupling factor transport system substrate-specific component
VSSGAGDPHAKPIGAGDPCANTGARLIPIRWRPALVLGICSALGLAAFGWPFLIDAEAAHDTSHAADAPWVFMLILPMLAAVVVAELTAGGLDAKAVALLGMLTAVGAALRALGPGAAGIEPAFVVIVLGGRVFGRGFGFVLGASTILCGALLTGGVGPWMPFQMFAAAWVGLGAGSLPRARGRVEVAIVAVYGLAAGLAYGLLINLWFWPFAGYDVETSYVPGGSLAENLGHYGRFWLTTSLGYDVPRGILTATLVVILAPTVLRALRRAARRAAFDTPAQFADPSQLTRRSVSDDPTIRHG